jgi:hypothetical protein
MSIGTGVRPLEDGLVLDLKFNEGAGAVLLDSSGNRNHGAFGAGAAAPTWASGWMKESKHALVVYEDDVSFWTIINSGAGAFSWTFAEELTEVQSGESSVKTTRGAGGSSFFGLEHIYAPKVDLSEYQIAAFWLYGNNSGLTINLDLASNTVWSAYKRFGILDNFTGWKLIVVDLINTGAVVGAYDQSSIERLSLFRVAGLPDLPYYVDRFIFDYFQPVLDFDGVANRVTIPNDASLHFGTSSDFCIFIDLLPLDAGTDEYIVCRDYGAPGYWQLFISNTDVLRYTQSGGFTSLVGTINIVDGEPHQVGVTCDRDGNAQLYVDGVADGVPRAMPGDNLSPTTTISLGSTNSPGNHYEGSISRLRIWKDRLLSAEDVALLYSQRRRV